MTPETLEGPQLPECLEMPVEEDEWGNTAANRQMEAKHYLQSDRSSEYKLHQYHQQVSKDTDDHRNSHRNPPHLCVLLHDLFDATLQNISPQTSTEKTCRTKLRCCVQVLLVHFCFPSFSVIHEQLIVKCLIAFDRFVNSIYILYVNTKEQN